MANHTLTVTVNSIVQYSGSINSAWDAQGLYFKQGSYCQDNTGASSEGSTVKTYALSVTHT